MSDLARLSSREWRDYDRATMRLLAAKPGTDEFTLALALANAAERDLERADLKESREMDDIGITVALEWVARMLRGRISECLLLRVLEAIDGLLDPPEGGPGRSASVPRKSLKTLARARAV